MLGTAQLSMVSYITDLVSAPQYRGILPIITPIPQSNAAAPPSQMVNEKKQPQFRIDSKKLVPPDQ